MLTDRPINMTDLERKMVAPILHMLIKNTAKKQITPSRKGMGFNCGVTTLHFTPDLAVSSKHAIRKIRFEWLSLENRPKYRVKLAFSDGTKSFFTGIPEEVRSYDSFQKLSTFLTSHHYPKNLAENTWQILQENCVGSWSNLSVYESETHRQYDAYHHSIITALTTFAQANSKTQLTIVDIGCGTGKLLKNLAENFGTATLFGIELDADNAKTAKRTAPSATILLGNAADPAIQKIIKKTPSDKLIVVSSGGVTQQVMRASTQIKIMHWLWHLCPDLTLICGVTAFLPDSIIRHTGFKIAGYTKPAATRKFIFHLTPEPLAHMVTRHIRRAATKTVLDLSFHPAPIALLREWLSRSATDKQHFQHITHIDLTGAAIAESEVETLLCLFKYFPKLKKVTCYTLEKSDPSMTREPENPSTWEIQTGCLQQARLIHLNPTALPTLEAYSHGSPYSPRTAPTPDIGYSSTRTYVTIGLTALAFAAVAWFGYKSKHPGAVKPTPTPV